MATSFALKLGKITGCGLCSTATKSRAVGWARELPVCSVMFPCWEDWMLYSTVGGAMNLFSCLGRVGELAPKPGRLFVVLTRADPCPNSLAELRHWLFSVDDQLCLLCSLIKRCWATQHSRCSGQAFLLGGAGSYIQQHVGLWISSSARWCREAGSKKPPRCSHLFFLVREWPGATLNHGLGYDYLPTWADGGQSSRSCKALCLRASIKQSCTQPSSLVRLHYSVFCRWEKLLVGTITWVLWEELSLPRPMCWLLQAPLLLHHN